MVCDNAQAIKGVYDDLWLLRINEWPSGWRN